MRRTVSAAVVFFLAVAVAVAGCGSAGGARGGAPGLRTRMAEVARAWEGSAALKEWREGFHLLEDPVRLPSGAFRDGYDKTAYAERNFALRGELPARPGQSVRIRWSDGTGLDVTTLSATATYEALTGRAPTRERPLTVTGARSGELTLNTSRGPALVPVWFFELEGYTEPLARVALANAEPPGPPIEPRQPFDGGVAEVFGHGVVDPTGAAFTVESGHGACDGGVAVEVLEGADTVVLGARILPSEKHPKGAACPAILLKATVPVTLTRPLGNRVLIDAVSGRALGYSGG
ncbi:hypothetical protein OHA37_11060 [Streptomyces sp. NBC_00335]|uniref:hypothetical protein n=1 Tax=unclassified Streptomyces TaxID=2593676 RepID=UPI00224DBC40|nr:MULTISPECIES: hypothetical protein [unclassified Streptomyces]MCX5404419.1 hypothetical protein [Streptomyces sp. NBC_00086]